MRPLRTRLGSAVNKTVDTILPFAQLTEEGVTGVIWQESLRASVDISDAHLLLQNFTRVSR